MEQQTTTVTPPPVGTKVMVYPDLSFYYNYRATVCEDMGNGFINVSVRGPGAFVAIKRMVPHKSIADTNSKGRIIEDYWDFIL